MTANNVVLGIVKDLKDPQNLGRVRAVLPQHGNQLSEWAPIVSAGAGNARGSYFRPEIDDQVMIVFERGDLRRPYVLGGVWCVPGPPPEKSGVNEVNDVRQIITRSGHVLRFDDKAGAERIELITAGGKQKVVLDKAGGGRIEVTATAGTVVVDAAGDVTVSSKANLTVTATGDISITASGALKLRGKTVDIN
ncbi:phage baseplate assembly protein V [Actinoplanes sp. NPDC023936]|uniref:phage baseplate assembly protein V n=1 Tax=Actinoplanes sp. NPDC023936 TaxID=3154910 RepID=UPI0033ED1913